MGKLLDIATIDIKFKLQGDFLAIIDLNWQDEFEVKFFRLSIRPDGTLWFQPPALKEQGWVKCFIVKDQSDWKSLQQKVIDQFVKQLQAKVEEGTAPQSLLDRIGTTQIEISDEDFDKIDKAI